MSWEQGRLAQAQDAFQRSLQLVRRGNDLGPRSSVLCDLAQVKLALGQADAAELLALECQQLALADGPVQAARADLLLARVAMGRMNSEAALFVSRAVGAFEQAVLIRPIRPIRASDAQARGDSMLSPNLFFWRMAWHSLCLVLGITAQK